jgi:homocysteine S-methyltransferase
MSNIQIWLSAQAGRQPQHEGVSGKVNDKKWTARGTRSIFIYGILSFMNPIASILDRYTVLVIDGALATELERRGCDLKDDLWSARVLLEQPEFIKQVHLDYFRAGADCAITASYQASIEGFTRRGLNKKQAIDLIQKSVKLAKEARDEFWADETNRAGRSKPFVAASVGPYGAFLADGSEYRGNYGLSAKELIDFHRPRMQALINAGADILACETIPCLIEAQAIAKLLTEFPNITAWVSFSARDGNHISEGQVFADCVQQLKNHPQIAAIGINCTSPKYISSLIREAKKGTEKPILVYPNSGETYSAEKNDWNGDPVADSFGEQAREWYEAGARLIGGCCRTTPEDIRVIASWARSRN